MTCNPYLAMTYLCPPKRGIHRQTIPDNLVQYSYRVKRPLPSVTALQISYFRDTPARLDLRANENRWSFCVNDCVVGLLAVREAELRSEALPSWSLVTR